MAQRKFKFDDLELQVTLSAGLAESGRADNPQSMVRRADAALYAAKQGGRNRGFYAEGSAFKPIRRSERHAVESVQMIAPLEGEELPIEASFYAAGAAWMSPPAGLLSSGPSGPP